MTEIICISCWSSFEFDETTLSGSRDVTCPNCGFVQPGPAQIPGPELDPTVETGTVPPSPELDLTIQDGRPPAELVASLSSAAPSVEVPRTGTRKKAERAVIAQTQVGPPPAPPEPKPEPEPVVEEERTSQMAAFSLPEEPAEPPPTIDPKEDPFRELQKVLADESAASGDDDDAPLVGEVSAVSTVLNDIYGEPAVSMPGVEDLELDVPEKDERWRLRTASGLVLFFPNYDTLARYLTGDENETWAVAMGPGPFRPLLPFLIASQTLEDPVKALVDVPPEDEDAVTEVLAAAAAEQAAEETALAEEIAASPPPAEQKTGKAPKLNTGTITGLRRPDAGASPSPSPMPRRSATQAPGKATARPGRRGRKSRPNVTGEFTLKAAKPKSPWPARVMFFVVGTGIGGGTVYYLAWLGVLPGILY